MCICWDSNYNEKSGKVENCWANIYGGMGFGGEKDLRQSF